MSRLHNAFANGSSANIKLSKAQLHKIGQLGGMLGRNLGPLLKTGLPLMKNVLETLAKSVLIPLRLIAAASAADAAIHKRCLDWVQQHTTLIISNEEMNDIMKIVKLLEKTVLSIKGVSGATQNEIKEQKNPGFLGILLGTLGASLLGNLLTGKGTIRAIEGKIGAALDF